MKTNDLIIQLVSFPSVTSDFKANQECLNFCQNFLKESGKNPVITISEGKPILHWGCDPEGAEILINSHIDVVPGTDELFTAKIMGKKMFGRGCADTKSSVAALLQTKLSNKKILFSLSCDEEIGGDSNREFIRKMKSLKFAIFAEPTNLKIINQAKGIMQIKIVSFGKNAHGSKPWLGENAIEHMAKNLHDFLKINPTPTRETNETTYNFSQIKGGTAINQTPSSCELLVDVRFNPNDDLNDITDKLARSFPQSNISIIKNESPILTDEASDWVTKFKLCISTYGGNPEAGFDHGSSDARHCTALGIPSIVFGPIGGNLHEAEEWVDLESINDFKLILETFIESC